jgi:hypothetical protein
MVVLRTLFGLALFSLVALGCSKNAGRRDLLVQRASFDLECPPEQLELTPLGTIPGSMGVIGSYGVKGCDQRATYVLSDGIWVANTPTSENQ